MSSDKKEKFFGTIEILSIHNFPETIIEGQGINLMENKNIRFVHYTDCQQLIIWLPSDHSKYNQIMIRDTDTGKIVFCESISSIVNGRIQIIIDTIPIPPGAYKITIDAHSGERHIITLKKIDQLIEKIQNSSIQLPVSEDRFGTIQYRDGFGDVIPNEDLITREKSLTKILDKIGRRLQYISHGRDGEVIYIEGSKSIRFYMEMGAYDCVFYLNIPSSADWENHTGFPIEEREDIIRFVAEGTQRDQASSCTYKISETEISYFRKKL